MSKVNLRLTVGRIVGGFFLHAFLVTAFAGIALADEKLPLKFKDYNIVFVSFDAMQAAHVHSLGYTSQEVRGKPSYVSYKTGKDGKYIVKIDQEGTYYITVRAKYSGGRPENGETLGIYGGDAAQPVIVKKQNVTKDIDIQVGQYVDNKQG